MVTTLFALVDKDGVCFGCGRKKGNDVISCGKDLKHVVFRISHRTALF